MIKVKRITKIKQACVAPEGYIPINILSWHPNDTPYYDLCPYVLKTDGKEEQANPGNIVFENFWQGSKVYPDVYSNRVYTHWQQRHKPEALLWKYDASDGKEAHLDPEKNIKPKYWIWRQSLWSCPNPIRYPNSFKHKHTVAFALLKKNNNTMERLDYIESRKRIYSQEYMRLVRPLASYKKLLKLVQKGKNICIFEIDVPAKGRRGEYGKNIDDNNTYDVTLDRVNKLLNDPSEPFGHGLCLAHALLEDKEKNLNGHVQQVN